MQINKHRDKRKADKRANIKTDMKMEMEKKKRASERGVKKEARVYNGKAGIKAQIVLW